MTLYRGFWSLHTSCSTLPEARSWWTAESWIHGKWEAALQRRSFGILESWNLGMCSKFGLKSRSGILESWNLRFIDQHKVENLWKTIYLHINRRFQDYRFHSLGERGVHGFQTWSRISYSMIPQSTGDMRTANTPTVHDSRLHASLLAAWSVVQNHVTQEV